MPKTKPTVSQLCKNCGTQFMTWKYRIDRGQSFCSVLCSSKFRAKPIGEKLANNLAKINDNGCINWTGRKTKWGYGTITISGKSRSAHRIAWEQAHGDIPNGLWVLHKCDNRLCCNPLHLFLGTVQDNVDDCCDKQRQTRGTMHGNHRLSDESVTLIRNKYATGKFTQVELAQEFGVLQTTISRVILRQSWKHV